MRRTPAGRSAGNVPRGIAICPCVITQSAPRHRTGRFTPLGAPRRRASLVLPRESRLEGLPASTGAAAP